MFTDMATVILAVGALLVSIITAYVNRIVIWRNRYWERWAFLGKMVIDDPTLFKLWCGKSHFETHFANTSVLTDPIEHKDCTFAELYIDFYLEVMSLNKISKIILGKFPGEVGVSNPLIQRIYKECLNTEYKNNKYQKILEKAFP